LNRNFNFRTILYILGMHCCYIQDRAVQYLLDHEEDDKMIIRNVGNYALNLAVFHPRINESSATPARECFKSQVWSLFFIDTPKKKKKNKMVI